MKADLHIHSTFSDGSMSIEDIIFYAKRMGLDTIAITDHDTMAGVKPACELGAKVGLNVIPGVEISTIDKKRGRSVHMLCYLPKHPKILKNFLDVNLQNRTKQKLGMIEKIMERYPVTMEHIERYSHKSESIYELHIMQALADLGYTNVVIGPLMDELISEKGTCYVESTYSDVMETLDVVRQAGGIAVMAHPGQFDSLELLEQLAKKNLLQGAEYNHSRNSEQVRAQIKDIAEKYGLILTGGTDFHGQYTKKVYPLGSFLCDEKAVKALYALSQESNR
ncbi:MAG: putative metal-dependent phosphoesterase family [Oscillospiraceae bacterium]|nr:putative metal-dependent phosphoesterase family [Oscillospiraceae bacterium]